MKQKRVFFLIFFCLGIVLTLNACAPQEAKENPMPLQNQKTNFSLEEVAKHNQKNDCWLVLEGKVYNVTEFVGIHPGQDAILEGCG